MQRRDFATVKKPSKDFATAKIIKYSNKKASEYIKQRMLTCLNKKLIKQFNSLILRDESVRSVNPPLIKFLNKSKLIYVLTTLNHVSYFIINDFRTSNYIMPIF